MRRKNQQRYEVDLSKYIAYQKLSIKSNSRENPTLMKDEELNEAIHLSTGKVDGKRTLRERVKQFSTYSDSTRSYRSFKDGLYEYLTDIIDYSYGKR